jgi:hypothetical protein
MYTSSVIMLLSLPVFIYISYLLVRLALKYLDREPEDTPPAE